jgi:hypothetical protein
MLTRFQLSSIWCLQKEHRLGVRARFETAVADIKRTMEAMADIFSSDSDDVHFEWVKYTHKVGRIDWNWLHF